ncbi:hypothetical protein [Pseudophaeobacter arcticus]|jgi:hypothetical protein|uniref:hypothetical protein n=1 Tax=Pseudophaeobacter arcticus TaxID=385492 RepID=UPI0039E334A9
MTDFYSNEADFEAEITILTSAQGGRNTPTYNFIRWDLGYPDRSEFEPVYMIWPNFLDEAGDPIPKGSQIEGTLRARMHIVVREMVEFHKQRLLVGSRFNCHEGRHVVAQGKVTKLLALSS